MELYAPCRFAFQTEGRVIDGVRRSYHLGVRRKPGYRVAMRHPHGRRGRDAGKKRISGIKHRKFRPAVFPGPGRRDLTASVLCEPLGAIAYPKQRELSPEALEVGLRGVWRRHRRGASRKNHSLEIGVAGWNPVERMDLAVDSGLAHLSRDELGVLRTEVEYKYLIHLLNSWGFPW